MNAVARFALVCAIASSSLIAGCQGAGRVLEPASAASVAAERSRFAAALFEEGRRLGQNGDHVRGEQYIEAAIEHGYPRVEAVPTLVRICIEASRYRAALNYAEPALTNDPADYHLRHVVGSLYLALGETGRARVELERVTHDAPEFAAAHFSLGVLIRDAFIDMDTVRHHFTRYVALEPRGEHAREAADWLDKHPQPSDESQRSGAPS